MWSHATFDVFLFALQPSRTSLSQFVSITCLFSPWRQHLNYESFRLPLHVCMAALLGSSHCFPMLICMFFHEGVWITDDFLTFLSRLLKSHYTGRGLQLWVCKTQSLFLYCYLLIIVLFSIQTTNCKSTFAPPCIYEFNWGELALLQ